MPRRVPVDKCNHMPPVLQLLCHSDTDNARSNDNYRENRIQLACFLHTLNL